MNLYIPLENVLGKKDFCESPQMWDFKIMGFINACYKIPSPMKRNITLKKNSEASKDLIRDDFFEKLSD